MRKKYNKFDIDSGIIYRNECKQGQYTDLSVKIIDKLEERIIFLLEKYNLVSKHKDDELNYRIRKYENLNDKIKHGDKNPFDGYYMFQYANPVIFPEPETKIDENGNILSPLLGTKVIEIYDPKHYCYDLFDFDKGIIITYKDDPEDYPFFFLYVKTI